MSLIGVSVSSKGTTLLMVLPYMRHGDVKSFLQSKRGGKIDITELPKVNIYPNHTMSLCAVCTVVSASAIARGKGWGGGESAPCSFSSDSVAYNILSNRFNVQHIHTFGYYIYLLGCHIPHYYLLQNIESLICLYKCCSCSCTPPYYKIELYISLFM